MPNWCSFTMYVKGTDESIETLKRAMDYDNLKEGEKFLARTFDVTHSKVSHDDNTTVHVFYGMVAWSIRTCWTKEHIMSYPSRDDECYTIDELAQKLDLHIEIMSDEGGNAFMEHYYVTPEGIQVSEAFDYPDIERSEFEDDEDYYERINEIVSQHHEELMYL
jgi:hypothetical protein